MPDVERAIPVVSRGRWGALTAALLLGALETSVQRGIRPPDSGFVPKPETGAVVNRCSIENTAPRPEP